MPLAGMRLAFSQQYGWHALEPSDSEGKGVGVLLCIPLLLWGLAGCHPDEPGPPPETPHPEVSWQKPAAVPVEPAAEPGGAPLSAEDSPPGAAPSADPLPASAVLTFPLEEPRAYYHEVQPGESLSVIGKKYGLTAPQLLAANGLDPGALLQPGQLIYVPGKTAEPE